eukprot:CAMPEP_0177625698 /NCGR_PEP_ID=MMETSP0419_2-20121207/30246_1 /TAXON_ID=582737 /ORGANISM="Tetraselmis sp., Strain GSL018" /LENGTH=355 /DNA_ID=CAMNT_0019126677 /DNA_START=1031 /DNA_END=2096 /DNA_ORIENTATION=-
MARGGGSGGGGGGGSSSASAVAKSSDPERVTRTIHVGGIPMDAISEEQLADYFKHVGEVIAVRKSGRFAWVEFESVKSANQALSLDGETLGNSSLRISQSKTPIHTAGWRRGGAGPGPVGGSAGMRGGAGAPPPMVPYPPPMAGAPPGYGPPPPAFPGGPVPYMPTPQPGAWGPTPPGPPPHGPGYGMPPPGAGPPPGAPPPPFNGGLPQYGGPHPGQLGGGPHHPHMPGGMPLQGHMDMGSPLTDPQVGTELVPQGSYHLQVVSPVLGQLAPGGDLDRDSRRGNTPSTGLLACLSRPLPKAHPTSPPGPAQPTWPRRADALETAHPSHTVGPAPLLAVLVMMVQATAGTGCPLV